jgi:hypothetical protein
LQVQARKLLAMPLPPKFKKYRIRHILYKLQIGEHDAQSA